MSTFLPSLNKNTIIHLQNLQTSFSNTVKIFKLWHSVCVVILSGLELNSIISVFRFSPTHSEVQKIFSCVLNYFGK